jgi:HSP20 family protein
VIRPPFDQIPDDARRFFDWLDDALPAASVPGEYHPPIDVLETVETLEIVADMPGVARDAIRVFVTGDALVITGRKLAPGCQERDAAFHLAERSFGRFGCALRLTVSIDASRARATLDAGELHIVLPRIEDRRGRQIEITIGPA